MKDTFFSRGSEYSKIFLDVLRSHLAEGDAERSGARHRILERLGGLRGLPQKIGQSMGLEAGLFDDLGEWGSPLSINKVQEILSLAWNCPWEEVLDLISPNGFSASIGQVHKARLLDGSWVAIKVQYPGIREAIYQDLKLLDAVGGLGSAIIPEFNFSTYRKVLLSNLENELDYRIEATKQSLYRESVSAKDLIFVPKVYPDLSSEKVLVTEWQEGSHIQEVEHWSESLRFTLGQSLVNHFIQMFFDHGLVHADPHSGNYRFLGGAKPKVVLYDYGCVATFSVEERLFLLRLILGAKQRAGDPFPFFVGLGFEKELLDPIRPKLPALCQILLEPFFHCGCFEHRKWQRSERISDLLGDDRWNFRLSGPPSLLFFIRGFQGLLHYLNRLNTSVCWSGIFNEVVSRHLAKALVLPLPNIPSGPGYETLAEFLHIQVLEDGQQKIALRFPATAVERMESLMGPALCERVNEQGLSLDSVVRHARETGYSPGELFSLTLDNRFIRVWLA